jgi:hypothetical protein
MLFRLRSVPNETNVEVAWRIGMNRGSNQSCGARTLNKWSDGPPLEPQGVQAIGDQNSSTFESTFGVAPGPIHGRQLPSAPV